MKRFISFITLIIINLLYLNPVIALEEGKWLFVEDEQYCYIGSKAEKTDLPDSKKRGNYY